MAKTQNQKLKLLYLMKILLEKTDETHPMTVAEIIAELAKYEITAERKSIYDDISMLRVFGLEIETQKSKSTGYYVADRTFELPELKLLVDLVQSSKFITHKKSMELIAKISTLASVNEAHQLTREVYVTNRIKTMNESIYYNVDRIHEAIGENRKISFQYFEYTVKKERRFKHDGAKYKISPFALSWDDENYYMIGYDSDAEKIKHYRVDKMVGIDITDELREGNGEFSKFDIAIYSQKIFGMFGGDEETVRLRFSNDLVGVVIDRFGKDIMIVPDGENHFTIMPRVFISPQFFGWLVSLGTKVQILEPQHVAKKYKEHIRQILDK